MQYFKATWVKKEVKDEEDEEDELKEANNLF